jgi:hypothetical protein
MHIIYFITLANCMMQTIPQDAGLYGKKHHDATTQN